MSGRPPALVQGPALILAACLALLVGGLVELATLHYSSPVWLAVASCVACTVAPALGRRHPASSALLAVGAVSAYQGLTNDPNGGFVVAATVLAFYYLGRDHPGTSPVRRIIGVICLALPAVVGASLSDHDSAIGGVGTWLVVVVLPTAVGRVAERRQQLVTRLGQAGEALRRDELRATDAAAAVERASVARELHDVVAHYVSVMVIQAGAARTVCTADPDAGRAALEAVEAAGRRALDELRRVLGALRRNPDDGLDGAVDLVQIRELCESVRAAGVHATLAATELGELPVDCSQAAYRIVQEALTNVVRHAPGAHATVVIRTREDQVEVVITDDGGRTRPGRRSLPSGGHGLVGMAERARWVGGTVRAGPRPDGGFRVAASIPVRPPLAPQHDDNLEARWAPEAADVVARRRDWPAMQRWFDPVAAAVFAVALGIDAGLRAGGSARVPSIVLGIVLGALVGLRRRRPMVYLLATLAVLGALTIVSETVSSDPLFGTFGLVLPTYTAAAWLPQRRAILAFAIWTGGAAVHAAGGHRPVGQFTGALVAAAVVFAVGRLTRAQRNLTAELETRNAALASQRDLRARHAVITERIRIARDLHLLIAQMITTMIVQAGTARELLSSDYAGAYAAAAEVEHSGREALTRMRRVLGVLRADRSVPLQPPPAVTVPAAAAAAAT